MKKIRTLILIAVVAAVALTVAFSAFAASFSDIPSGAYYEGAADRMAEKGILAGFGDGRFYFSRPLKEGKGFASLTELYEMTPNGIFCRKL